MSGLYFVGGLLGLSVGAISLPFVMYKLGVWSVKRDLKVNIEYIESLKETQQKVFEDILKEHREMIDELESKDLSQFLKIKSN